MPINSLARSKIGCSMMIKSNRFCRYKFHNDRNLLLLLRQGFISTNTNNQMRRLLSSSSSSTIQDDVVSNSSSTTTDDSSSVLFQKSSSSISTSTSTSLIEEHHPHPQSESQSLLNYQQLYDFTSTECNIPISIQQCIGRNLHLQINHPLYIIQKHICYYFNHILPKQQQQQQQVSHEQQEKDKGDKVMKENKDSNDNEEPYFYIYDNLSPIVTTKECFDELLIDTYHPSRSKSDTYYVNETTVLRPHTSTHQIALLKKHYYVNNDNNNDTNTTDSIDQNDMNVNNNKSNQNEYTENEVSSNNSSNTNIYETNANISKETVHATLTKQRNTKPPQFLVIGDVYRRDEIDKTHYPIFHQIEGVKLFHINNYELEYDTLDKIMKNDLRLTLEGMIRYLFKEKNKKQNNKTNKKKKNINNKYSDTTNNKDITNQLNAVQTNDNNNVDTNDNNTKNEIDGSNNIDKNDVFDDNNNSVHDNTATSTTTTKNNNDTSTAPNNNNNDNATLNDTNANNIDTATTSNKDTNTDNNNNNNGPIKMRWRKDSFPFTDPSYELDIYYNNEWIEILGCGIIHYEILNNANIHYKNSKGWAFGIGLERLAMILFNIPDIRLFWSNDIRFIEQFNSGTLNINYQSFSKYPPCIKDISIWIKDYENYHVNDMYEIVRSIGGNLIERMELIDVYTKINKKDITLTKVSHCYRITYRSMERSLTNHEIDTIQEQIRQQVVQQLNVELR